LSTSSLSLGIAAGVLYIYPVICSGAKVKDVHIIKGWLSFSKFKVVEEEAFLTACTLNALSAIWQTELLDGCSQA